MAVSAPKKGSKFNFSSAIEETVNKRHFEPIKEDAKKEENPTEEKEKNSEPQEETSKELKDTENIKAHSKTELLLEKDASSTNKDEISNEAVQITKKEKLPKKLSISINREKPAKEQVKALDLNFTNPKVIMLTHDINKFFRIRAKQLGLTFTEYFNVLLWDYRENNKKKGNSVEDIYEICTEKYSGKKERNNIFFTEQDTKYIEEETINAGVTLTQFACYLIGLEMQREEIEGKRK